MHQYNQCYFLNVFVFVKCSACKVYLYISLLFNICKDTAVHFLHYSVVPPSSVA